MNARSSMQVACTAKILLTIVLFALTVVPVAHGQLVADGASATLNNVTNSITGHVIVGTNGSFTRLTLTNGALLTNTLNGFIGLNQTARSNTVWLTGAETRWRMGQDLFVGTNGAFNRLVVSNGALANCRFGYIGWDAAASNNVALVAGAGSRWANSSSLIVGFGGAGSQLVVSNGGVVANTHAYLNYNPGASNNLAVVTGAGSLWTNNGGLSVGFNGGSGSQLVVSNGGTLSTSGSYLGDHALASNNLAVVTGTGSLWTNNGFFNVGYFGSGSQLVVSNGGAVGANSFVVGAAASSTNNRLTVDGGTLRATIAGGTGALDIRNGATVLKAGLIVVDSLLLTNSAGSFAFNGGTLITRSGTINNGLPFAVGLTTNYPAATWVVLSNATPTTINGDLNIGSNAPNASLFITNGGTVNSTRGYIGHSANATNNTVSLSGPNSTWNSGQLMVGSRGSRNTLLINNGATVSSAGANIGFEPSSSGNAVIVNGPNSTWNNSSTLWVGNMAAGSTLLVTNGGTVNNTLCNLGYFGANNAVTVSGANSLWNNSGLLTVGLGGAVGSGSLLVNSGASASADGIIVGGGSYANNLVTVDGGTLRVTNVAVSAALDIRRGTNVLNAGLIATDRLWMTNVAGKFSFNGGTLSMGSSTVNNGLPFVVGNGSSVATLELLGSGLHTFTNGLTVSDNATLAGNGTLSGVLTLLSGGTVSPGTSIGKLILNNPPVLQGDLVMEISKNGPTLTNDQIQVTGALTNNGTITVLWAGSDTLLPGDSFKLFNASSYSGSGFSNVILPALPGVVWTNKLLVDGTIAVLNIAAPFYSVPIASLPQVYLGSLAWGDYDNDSRLDLLFTGRGAGESGVAQLWRNTGSGFTNVPIAGLPPTDFGSVAWGDYNNDGRLDFLLTGTTNYSTGISQLWRNTGSGFTNVTATAFPAGLPQTFYGSAVWGDYDNDGRLDFLLTGTTNNSVGIAQLWRNTGSGFTNVTAATFPAGTPPGVINSFVGWGDYDSDGRLDFLLTGQGNSGSGSGYVGQLWRNSGSGFTNVPVAGLPEIQGGSVEWGDYDNDGRLDFLLTGGNEVGNYSQLWRNTTSGFSNVTATIAPGLPQISSSSAAWGDYDNDGRLDFLLTGNNGSSYYSQLWRNTGGGFTNATDSVVPGLPGIGASSVAWGDYDHDGRLDFLVSGSTNFTSSGARLQLWRNNTPVTNAPPSAPTGLAMTATTNAVMLSWKAATDDRTPATGLTYNVRAGTTPGGTNLNLLAAHVNAATGFRRVPALGNAYLRHTLPLTGLTNGQTVYWSVQAVDTSFAGGPFATETSVVSLPQLTITRSNAANAILSWTPPTFGWRLQESPSLTPAAWSNSPSGELNPASVGTTNTAKLYRLKN